MFFKSRMFTQVNCCRVSREKFVSKIRFPVGIKNRWRAYFRNFFFACAPRERKCSTYRWSTCHWSFWGTTNRRAIPPGICRVRYSSSTQSNSGYRSRGSPQRSPGQARLWWRCRRSANAIDTAVCSSSWDPAKIISIKALIKL